MKKNKLKLITKILAILVVCLISFVGIYVQNANRMENIITQIADYKFTKDLKGYRQIVLKVEDKSKENISTENIEKAKEIIEYRLNNLKYKPYNGSLEEALVKDYNISADKENGTIYIQIPENDYTDRIVSNIKEIGGIELKDSEGEKVFVDKSNLKNAKVNYITNNSGIVAFVEMEFNKEGIEKLKELNSEEYATVEENDEENKEEKSEETKQKKLTLAISGNEVLSDTYDNFKKNNMIEIEKGIIRFSVNQTVSTDIDDTNYYILSGYILSTLINGEIMPISYEITENQYMKSEIFDVTKIVSISVLLALLVIAFVYMIAKFKVRGLLSAISFIGFLATYLLLIRLTNVEICLEGIVSIILVLALNYIFSIKLLKVNNDKKEYSKQYKDGILKMIPIFAISIIFSLMNWTVLNSFGMCMFWGILLILVYNVLVTKKIVE